MFHEMTLKLYFMKCSERKFQSASFPLKISQNSQESTCVKILLKKKDLTQLLSFEFSEIIKDTFLENISGGC